MESFTIFILMILMVVIVFSIIYAIYNPSIIYSLFTSCEYYFPSYKFRPKVEYIVKDKTFNGLKNEVILTVPHKCFQNNQKPNHNCDYMADEMSDYINDYLLKHYIVQLYKSNEKRTEIDDNRVNASLGLTRKEFVENFKDKIELPNEHS